MKTIVVADKYRTNELSLVPGGVSVTAVYNDGSQRVYLNVKNVDRFACKVKTNPQVKEILVKKTTYWKRSEKKK